MLNNIFHKITTTTNKLVSAIQIEVLNINTQQKDSEKNIVESIENVSKTISGKTEIKISNLDQFPKENNAEVVDGLNEISHKISDINIPTKVEISKPIWYNEIITSIKGIAQSVLSVRITNKPSVVVVDEKGVPVDFTKMGGARMISNGPKSIWLQNISGDKVNPSTEAKQDEMITAVNNISSGGEDINYKFVVSEIDGAYEYSLLKEHGGEHWQIQREELSIGRFSYAYGTEDYQDNWDDKETLTYNLE